MEQKLFRMVQEAYSNVPLYRDKGVEIQEDMDSSDIPVLTKEEILLDWERAISSQYLMPYLQNTLSSSWTSGSTGTCLRVLWTKGQFHESLFPLWTLRSYFYHITPTDRFCYFYNTPNVSQKQKGDVAYETIENAMGFCKENLSEKNVIEIIKIMQEYKPKWLMLQPSIALILADVIDNCMEDDVLDIQYIELSGEMLLDQHRNYIKKIFGCDVVNQYGCHELNSVAYECPSGQLHCLESNVHVEIVEGQRSLPDGEEGEVCLTTMNNKVMPLVRYKIGDFGVLDHQHHCSCGLKSPVLYLTKARSITMIKHEDGSESTPYLFVHAVDSVVKKYGDIILQFRVIQKEYTYFQVILVVNDEVYDEMEDLSDSLEDTFLNSIHETKMMDCEFEFIYTNRILSEKHLKKFSYFISEVESEMSNMRMEK